MRVTPFSPPEGEAACGDHPLDPISLFLPSLKIISRQPSEEILHFFKDGLTVRTEATITATQKSVRIIFP